MNILFDLDGTLVESDRGIVRSYQYSFKKLGKRPPTAAQLKKCIGPTLYNSFAGFLETKNPKLLKKAIRFYRERYNKIGLFEGKVYSGLFPLLKKLKKERHHLYVATAKPEVYAKRIIRHFDLAPYFLEVYGSRLNGVRTDKGELLSYLLRKERLSPGQTLMIGDRKHDIVGARKNKVRALGVTYGYGTQIELKRARPIGLCRKPSEIIRFID